jgi:hypothetical protein
VLLQTAKILRNALSWIVKSKEWIFSGIGVAIIVSLVNIVTNSRSQFDAHTDIDDSAVALDAQVDPKAKKCVELVKKKQRYEKYQQVDSYLVDTARTHFPGDKGLLLDMEDGVDEAQATLKQVEKQLRRECEPKYYED